MLKLLDDVYTTGKVHSESESLMFFNGNDGVNKFYVDFEYAPLRETDAGISGNKNY
jgi:hypothetical protein